MAQTKTTGPLRDLFDSYKAGKISRRGFAQGAAAIGVAAPLISFLGNQVSAQDAGAAVRPASGTEGQTRGAGGTLNIIQWQAITLLSPHISSGTKDLLGAQPILEPLIHYLPDSQMIPNLLTKVPSVEDGDLAEDMTWVTLTLLPDVLWSDGTPFTSADVGFTLDWVGDPNNNSVNIGEVESVSGWEASDDLTITVNFSAPNPFWFTPFTGSSTGYVYPKHILEAEGSHEQFLLNPVGTGPYVVESFTPNDELRLVANENYREPNKPFFSNVVIKGGGDAAAAARAVLQSGESDFAWNLVVEPDVLNAMEAPDNPGTLLPYAGVQVERVNFNFSDPNTEVDGQRSEMNTPHPFFSDPAVREAVSMAINRDTIATNFYGPTQPAAVNILNGDPRTDSPNTVFNFDPEAARALLDEAGWTLDGDVRKKDGVELKLDFATSVNPVRQKSQAVIKANLDDIGFKVNLQQVDSGIYFDTGEGNDQSIYHMYWDMNMYTGVPSSPRPIGFFEAWYAGENGSNIAQASNKWLGNNTQRYNNPEYDALWTATRTETDPEQLADNFIALNDIVINDRVIIPLVVVGAARGVSKRLNPENIALAPFSYDYWNIANWNLAE